MPTEPLLVAGFLILALTALWLMSTVKRLTASELQRYRAKTRTPVWHWVVLHLAVLVAAFLYYFQTGFTVRFLIAVTMGGFLIWTFVDNQHKIHTCGFSRKIRHRFLVFNLCQVVGYSLLIAFVVLRFQRAS